MSQRLNPLETARRRAVAAGNLIDFSRTSFSAAGVRWPEDLYERAWRLWREDAEYRPSGRGGVRARQAVADAYVREGMPVFAEDVVLTAGSSISYHLIFSMVRRRNHSSRVALPIPGYPLFEGILNPLGMEPVWYHCPPENGFLPQLDQIAALLSNRDSRPAALVLITPNNPAGVTYPDDLIANVAQMCAAASVQLVMDEVFSLFRPEDTGYVARGATNDGAHSTDDVQSPDCAPVIHLNGLSKLCAAPEMKLGWIVLSGGSQSLRATLTEDLDTEHDTYLSLSGLGEAAAIAFSEGEAPRRAWNDLRRTVGTLREEMVRGLAGVPGIHPAPVDSGIHVPFRLDPLVAAARVGTVDDEAIAIQLVERSGVLVHPGYFYGLDDPVFAGGPWFVASSLIKMEERERGIERLHAVLRR